MSKDGVWSLSPAYDMCHAYRPGSSWVSQHSLSINGKRQNISRNDLLELAINMNIKKSKKILDQIGKVVTNWTHFAEEQKVVPILSDAIKKTLLIL